MRSKSMTVIAALIAVFAISAVGAGTAFASGTPTVETKPATNIAESSATLNGAVNPNGVETKYYFEYGTTTKYGTKTAEVSAGSGTSNLEESKAITGLAIGTYYHFRLVATNVNGTSDGADKEFMATLKKGPEFVPGEGAKFPIAFQDAAQKRTSFFEPNSGLGESPFCTGSQVKGEITGAKVASVTLEFTGCAFYEKPVWTGELWETGTVVLQGIGTPVYIDKAEKKVALLDVLTKTSLKFSEGTFAQIKGTLLIPVTPLNTSTTKFALPIHKTGGAGLQEYRSRENEKNEVVKYVHPDYEPYSGGGFVEAAIEMEGKNEVLNEVTAGSALTVKG
jgi:hypothetical protein